MGVERTRMGEGILVCFTLVGHCNPWLCIGGGAGQRVGCVHVGEHRTVLCIDHDGGCALHPVVLAACRG